MSIPPPKQKPARVTQTFDVTLTPQACGLLDTIAGTESPGYNTVYGGGTVNDLSKHPNLPIPITRGPHTGETSSAAGRYQFLKGTWDEAADALGLKDFSPQRKVVGPVGLERTTTRLKVPNFGLPAIAKDCQPSP